MMPVVRARTLVRLSTCALLGAFLSVSTPASAQTFPQDGQWAPITNGGVPVGDPLGDSQTARDIVGDASTPAAYVFGDATHLFFRLRVDGEILQSGETNYKPFGWACLLDTNQNLSDYELSAGVDGIANPDVVELRQNTVMSSPDDPKDIAELVLQGYSPQTHARQVAAPSFFDETQDYFIDWAVDKADLAAAGVTASTPIRFICGSSNNASNLAADLISVSGATTLSGLGTDTLSCGPSGCSAPVSSGCAGEGEPCSAGVGACSATGVLVCADGASVCSAVPGSGSAELCDGLDNDCDGTVDDGFALGSACSSGTGACAATGTFVCDALGGVTCSAAGASPSAELCDGLDNDCDGEVDEGFSLGGACSSGVGACAATGVFVCHGDEEVACSAVAGSASAELCDGIDNDCDGEVDEGFSLGAACSAGAGACAATGTIVCDATGAAVCDAVPGQPVGELCDGADDDCDGQADEGFSLGAPCSVGVGECQSAGVFVCGPLGTAVCSAEPGEPEEEQCDGLDNDCDGVVDDGFGVGADCSVGVGECLVAGVIVCNAGGGASCDAAPGVPTGEVCDGADNDCDGVADNGLDVGAPCFDGLGSCVMAGFIACNAEGAAVCSAVAGEPQPEVCNGFDDDCDGEVDDGFDLGMACSGGIGPCFAAGVIVCDGSGAATCSEAPGLPTRELCDGVDNDCDGEVDGGLDLGAPCSVGVGACNRVGALVCDGSGAVTCSASPGTPVGEVCNRQDDDCDGVVDNGFAVGAGCSVGVGACSATGTLQCDDGGGVACDVAPGTPSKEMCDALDNDCDGDVDEGLGLGGECGVGVGECFVAGTLVCDAGLGVACNAVPGEPVGEACDGKDNDCDGAIDEGIGVGEPCSVGLGVCAAAGTTVCDGPDAVVCNALPGSPAKEICDGVDNDCDGAIDDGFGLGDPCVAGVGACAATGTLACSAGGGTMCVAMIGKPLPEKCDGVDNDCDGAIDEGCADADQDGLSDVAELALGTSAKDSDSDDDGVPDGAEAGLSADTDGDGLINALDADSDGDGLFDGTEVGRDCSDPGTNVAAGHCFPDSDNGQSTTSPLLGDTDGGGLSDGQEDADHDGAIDGGETDPTNPGDDLDKDGDGVTNDVEVELGTDIGDADCDDDGVPDGAEVDPSADTDGDGLVNALDPDSDGDGLFDGTELGRGCDDLGTDVAAGHCIPDGDSGATTTSPVGADSDGGGKLDGAEDLDKDGVVDPDETDPNDPSDDVAEVEVVPGCEDDSDCGGAGSGEVCDLEHRECVEGCRDGSACADDQVCIAIAGDLGVCEDVERVAAGGGGFRCSVQAGAPERSGSSWPVAALLCAAGLAVLRKRARKQG